MKQFICLICGKENKTKKKGKYCSDECAEKAFILISRRLAMIQRCKTNKNYTNIKICDEWIKSKEKYIKWCLENGWKKELTIDRKNNLKNYCPENCHFITMRENSRNTRTNKTDYKKKTRICSMCKKNKKFEDFPKNKCKGEGIGNSCKECWREYINKRNAILRKKYFKVCLTCEKNFESSRTRQKFCSTNCRKAFNVGHS